MTKTKALDLAKTAAAELARVHPCDSGRQRQLAQSITDLVGPRWPKAVRDAAGMPASQRVW